MTTTQKPRQLIKIFSPPVCLILLLSSCITIKTEGFQGSDEYPSEQTANYSGKPMVMREFTVDGFSEISGTSAIKFFIKNGDRQKVLVNTNAPDMIAVSSSNGTLHVGYKKNIPMHNVNTEVSVYAPSIKKIDVSGAAKINLEQGFCESNLSLKLSGAGKISGDICADRVDVEASGAAHLVAGLKAKSVNIEASSASKIVVSGITDEISVTGSNAAKISLENLRYNKLNRDLSSAAKIYTK